MRSVLLGVLMALAVLAIPAEVSAQGQGDPCGPRQVTAREYAAWSGPWAKHGAYLEVDPRGCGVLSWRIYEWCPPGPRLRPCDWMEGNMIQYGGGGAFRLDARHGASASGRVVLSLDPAMHARPGIVLTDNGDGTLAVEWHDQPQVFCRTWAWIVERCGA